MFLHRRGRLSFGFAASLFLFASTTAFAQQAVPQASPRPLGLVIGEATTYEVAKAVERRGGKIVSAVAPSISFQDGFSYPNPYRIVVDAEGIQNVNYKTALFIFDSGRLRSILFNFGKITPQQVAAIVAFVTKEYGQPFASGSLTIWNVGDVVVDLADNTDQPDGGAGLGMKKAGVDVIGNEKEDAYTDLGRKRTEFYRLAE